MKHNDGIKNLITTKRQNLQIFKMSGGEATPKAAKTSKIQDKAKPAAAKTAKKSAAKKVKKTTPKKAKKSAAAKKAKTLKKRI